MKDDYGNCYICHGKMKSYNISTGVSCKNCGYNLGFNDWERIDKQRIGKMSKLELKKLFEGRLEGAKHAAKYYQNLVEKLSL